MKNCRSALLLFAACLFAFSISAFAFGQETPNRSGNDAPKARQVRRAPRPQFDPADQASFWFGDLFAEALRGERPQSAGDAAPTVSAPAADLVEEVPAAGGWSEVIAANVLEDEIKRQQNRLGSLITNPGQFQSRNIETGEAFSMLATMFAIIASYDGQVRWRDQGEAVAAGLAAAAGRTRTADAAAFRSASEASSRLADLIRGGSFGNEPGAGPITDWSLVADRTVLMTRLETSTGGPLREALVSSDSMASDSDSILHEAAIIAAIGRVLQQPELPDADDEDFRQLAEEMVAASRELGQAAAREDFDAAVAALNRINQSCVACHADWR
jgi:hypothetical protein